MTSQNHHERAQPLDQIQTDMASQAGTQRDVTTDKTPLSADTSENLGIAEIPPKEVRYTLSTDDLVHDFRVAGITKNKRTITRYLEKGLIDAAKLDSGAWVANAMVCSPRSGPLFELVPASDMELNYGQEAEA